MNGQLFKDLQLLEVTLTENECIDDDYSHSSKLPVKVGSNEFLLEVSKKCGFTESAAKKRVSCLKDDCGDGKNKVCCIFDKASVIDSRDVQISDRWHDAVTDISLNQNISHMMQ